MLSRADAAIVSRDRHVPGLALLLDDDAFARRLSELAGGTAIRDARGTYVRYKPGTSCLVAYEVQTGDGPCLVYAKAFRPSLEIKLDNAVERHQVVGSLGFGVGIIGDCSVAVYEFPNDHALKSVLKFAHPPDGTWRKKVVGRRPELWSVEPRTLRYKPERRYVARLDGEGESVVVKCYLPSEFDRRLSSAHLLDECRGVAAQELLHASSRHSMLAFRWCRERSLTESIRADQAAPGQYRRVGDAIATLHHQAIEFPCRCDLSGFAQGVIEAADAMADVDQGLGERAMILAERAVDLLTGHAWGHAPIHGDLSPDQVLIGPGGVVRLLDFDRASMADPAVDLGSFEASLIRHGKELGLSGEDVAGAVREMHAGYARQSGRDLRAASRPFAACMLIRLAMEPFRHRSKEWPIRSDAILSVAGELLSDAGVRA